MILAVVILSIMVVVILVMMTNIRVLLHFERETSKNRTERLALLCTHALETIKDIFEQDLKLKETIQGQSDNIAYINEIEKEMEKIINEQA